MTTFSRQVLAALLIATGLHAQPPQPARVIPEAPLFCFHIDGPAALRAAFLPTNAGKLFDGPEFKEMLAPVTQQVEMMKQQSGGQLPFDIAALEKAVLDYRGRLTIAGHLLTENPDFSGPEPPAFAVTFVLSPDGTTDLAGFCKTTADIAHQRIGARLKDVDAAGTTLTYLDEADDPAFSLPFMHKGHAIFFYSNRMAEAGTRVLTAETVFTSSEAVATASLGAEIDTSRVVSLLASAMANQLGPIWDAYGKSVFDNIGLRSLATSYFACRPKGPHVFTEISLGFNQNDRGLLGVTFPSQAGRPALADVLPRNAMSANACYLDIGQFVRTAKRIFAAMGENAPMRWEEVEESFKQQFGLRLQEDLIDTFGKSACSVQMEHLAATPDDPFSKVNGMSIGFALMDGATLEKSIDKLLRASGMHAGRRKTEFGDYVVYDIAVMDQPIYYSITNDALLIGVGEAGGDPVRAILTEMKARSAGEEPAAFPDKVQQRLRMLGGDWSGIAWSRVDEALGAAIGQMEIDASGAPPHVQMIAGVLGRIPKLLKTYEMETQVGVARAKGSRWVYQSIW